MKHAIDALERELKKNNVLVKKMESELKNGAHVGDLRLAFAASIKFCKEQNDEIKKAIKILKQSGVEDSGQAQ